MSSRSMVVRLGRTFGVAALALALTAPMTLAAGEPGSGGGGGGGGTVTPTPTAAPCATVESFTMKGSKGGATAEVLTGFNIVSCSTNTESIVYDMVLSGAFTKVIYWTVSDWPAGTLAAGKSTSEKWTMGGVPYYTATRLDITVKDAATGAVLATKVASTAAVSGKP